jgi:hypothetical protein
MEDMEKSGMGDCVKGLFNIEERDEESLAENTLEKR